MNIKGTVKITEPVNGEFIDFAAYAKKVEGKVDKVDGKGLSTNDYTTAEKTKLAGVEAGATKTVIDAALSDTSTNPVQNKIVDAAVGSLKNDIAQMDYHNVLRDSDITDGNNPSKGLTWTVDKTDLTVTLTSTKTQTGVSIAFYYNADINVMPDYVEAGKTYVLDVTSTSSNCRLQLYYTFSDGTKSSIAYYDSGKYTITIPSNTTGFGIRGYITVGFSGSCTFKAIMYKVLPEDNAVIKSMYDRHKPFAVSDAQPYGYTDINYLYFNPVFRSYRKAYFSDYRIQCAIKIDDGIYVIGNSGNDETAGASKITQITAYNDPTAIKTLEWQGGHCNDATYDADTGFLYVSCGGNGATMPEGDTKPNQVSVIDMSTLTFSKYLTISDVGDIASIELYNGIWYIRDDESLYAYTLYGDTFTRIGLIHTFDFDALLGNNKSLTRQSMIINNGILYQLFALELENYTVFTNCLLYKYDLINNENLGVLSAEVPAGDEAEGVIIDDGYVYVFGDGNCYSVCRSNIKYIDVSDHYITLEKDLETDIEKKKITDLNDCLAPGHYFSRGKVSTDAIKNLPEGVTGAFTMTVENQEARSILQTIVPTSISPGITVYKRRLLTGGSISNWYKFASVEVT